MSDTELEPCPFCGKETATDHIKYDNCFVVRCPPCGYVSAHTASERGAIQNHNSLCRMLKAAGNAAAMREALLIVKRLFDGRIMFQPAIRKAHKAVDAALAAPPRNCDRFADELDAQLAFLNEVWLISVDRETMLERDKFENWSDEMRTRYGRWLFAQATEKKEGGAA